MQVILRPSVVLLAALALVLVGAGAVMARLDRASAAGGGGAPPDTPTATATYTPVPSAKADLVIKSIEVFPPKPEVGELFDVVITISNQGSVAAGAFSLPPSQVPKGP